MTPDERNKSPKHHLFGLAPPPEDGHTRITKGKGFAIQGGDKETHEVMVERTLIVADELKQKGTTIAGANCEQMREAMERSEEKMGD